MSSLEPQVSTAWRLGDVIILPDDEPEAALEACQRACLEAQKAGFLHLSASDLESNCSSIFK